MTIKDKIIAADKRWDENCAHKNEGRLAEMPDTKQSHVTSKSLQ